MTNLLHLLLPCAVLAAQGTQGPLEEILQACRKMHPEATRPVAAPRTLQLGGMQLTFERGTLGLLKGQDRTFGCFFQGQATLQVRATDPGMAALLAFNLEHNTPHRTQASSAGHTATLKATQVAVYTLGNLDLGGPAEGGEDLQSAWKDHLLGFAPPARTPVAHRLAQTALAGRSDLVVVECLVGTDRLTYFYDPSGERIERLDLLRPARSRLPEFTNIVTLFEQPLGWSRPDGQMPPFFLTHIDLTLKESRANHGAAQVMATVTPLRGGDRSLRFQLRQFQVVDAGKSDFQYQPIQVKRVTTAEGKPLDFSHQGHELLVALDQPTGETDLKLAFELEGDFLSTPAGTSYWFLDQGAWFPMAPGNGNLFTYRATIEPRPGFTAIVGGKTLKRQKTGGVERLEVASDKPVHDLPVAAGKFVAQEQVVPAPKAGGSAVTVRYWGYLDSGAGDKAVLDRFASYVQTSQQLLGPFPYPELNLVWGPGGMFACAPAVLGPGLMDRACWSGCGAWTHAGFVTHSGMAPEYTRPYARAGNNDAWQAAGEAMMVTHQYFGAMVRPMSSQDAWMVEALASHAARILVGAIPGTGQQWREAMLKVHQNEAERLGTSLPLGLSGMLDTYEPDVAAIRQGLFHSGAAALLDRVSHIGSDKDLVRFMRLVEANFAWKLMNSQQPRLILDKLTRQDLSSLWNPIVFGTPHP